MVLDQNLIRHFPGLCKDLGRGALVFLATLVALHFTPVSKWVSESAEFRTSVASRLASLFL